MGIVMENVIKKFNIGTKNEVSILKGIDIKIDNAEMVAIKGRSGAGKSTLMHIIGCTDSHTSGLYHLDSQDVLKMNDVQKAKLRNKKFGYIMQDFGIINDDTVYHNVALPMLFGTEPLFNISKKVDEALKKLGILSLRDRIAESLSGGEKQRVAIARALVNNPDYILADEPTGALDTENSEMIMEILVGLKSEGKTVIVITHDDYVARRCERIIKLNDGIVTL